MESEGRSPCSQEPASGPYPETDQASLNSRNIYKIHFNIIAHLCPLMPCSQEPASGLLSRERSG
jgi:hypothetical protein